MKAINWVWALAVIGGCAVDGDEVSAPEAATTEQAATTTDVWHGTWNGGSASTQQWTPTSGLWLDVFENKAGQNRAAYLNFSAWSVDPNSRQCFTWTDWWGWTYEWCYYTKYSYAYGWGEIPEHDAQIVPNHAHLSTTLPSTFGGYQCTVDYSTWWFQCGPAAGGTVDVTWNPNGGYSVFHSGVDQYEYGPYTFKSQGTYRYSTALASGTVLGTSFVDAYGQFGDTRQTNVSKYVMQTPTP